MSTTSRARRFHCAVALVASTIMVSACGSPTTSSNGGGALAGDGGTLSIATGGTGGVFYPLGGGLATVIRDNIDGYDATVQETNASVDNMLLLKNGSAQLALATGDAVADAAKGAGQFEGNPVDICSLGVIYNNFIQTVSVQEAGITSVEDMAGKVVSVGAPGSASEITALRILEAAGIDPENGVQRRQLGVAETVAALRDGTVDVGFWSGGLPTGALIDLASDGDMVLVPNGQYAQPLAAEFGDYYFAKDIPAGTYQGQTQPVPTIASPNLLVASASMDEQLQENITRAMFENKEALVQVHPAAGELDAATAGDASYVKTCPGAQRYFDEVSG